MTIRGATSLTVRRAIETGDPLPGTAGFAGAIDGRLVRDVLGRHPLFVDGDEWAFSPIDLETPRPVPAGHVGTAGRWERVFELPSPAPDPEALERLEGAIEETVASVDGDGCAVAFSGGVDSTLLAALLPEAPLYTIGFPESHDLEAATTAAAALDRDLHTHTVDVHTIEDAVPGVARAIGRPDGMDVSIALGIALLAERVAADGHETLVLGQGADELFGGYEKVAALDHRLDATTVRGAVNEVIETLPAQLERDVLAVRSATIEPVFPYLHDRVVDAALRLPDELLVDGDTRKRGLRQVADGHLPAELAWREKKAMQYGTLLSRELDRLARQAGFKRREGDHVTSYVRDRL